MFNLWHTPDLFFFNHLNLRMNEHDFPNERKSTYMCKNIKNHIIGHSKKSCPVNVANTVIESHYTTPLHNVLLLVTIFSDIKIIREFLYISWKKINMNGAYLYIYQIMNIDI